MVVSICGDASSGRLRKCDAENPILFQIKVTAHPSFI